MIKLMIFSILAAFTISVSAQQKTGIKVPDNVVKAFQSIHPAAKNLSWDREGINYEANYKENDNSYSVVINKEGKILETESEISISDLPAGVVKYISDNYKGYKLSGAAKIVDDKGNIKYEAEIKNTGSSKDIMFDKHGNPLHPKKQIRENEEKDGD